MPSVTSPDGTRIAYTRTGSGPTLILVDGAMCYRAAGPLQPLAAALEDSFTVYTYDRRGRGESTDTQPYAVAREIEDLQALVAETGGEAYVYGISSGAALALATAEVTPAITKLALYEPPFIAASENPAATTEYATHLNELLAAGRKGAAIAHFMTNVGVPQQMIATLRTQPAWPVLEAIAHTLAYDAEILGDGRIPTLNITIPTLVMSGSASPHTLQQAAKALAATLPTATHQSLPNQTHDVNPQVLTTPLKTFLAQ
ncbi:alpha/beta hydrolase [Actinocrispum sp. NPDC049592]|uniref:alpha/beta fold hydrolase n=1 Tax=Actinocrispum sp. NPDC049592 TaxID=3154835 RepID=UPI00342809C1